MNQLLWAVHCLDAPGAADRRTALRSQHSQWLRSGAVTPVLYGPLTDEEGRATGSLIVVAASDRAVVEEHFAADPFRAGGVWSQVRIDVFAPSERSPVRPSPPTGS